MLNIIKSHFVTIVRHRVKITYPSYLSFYPYSSLEKDLHNSLCAPFPALNTNKNSAQYVKVISTRCLGNHCFWRQLYTGGEATVHFIHHKNE